MENIFKNFISTMAILLWISGLIAIISGTVELGIAIWLVNVINGLLVFGRNVLLRKPQMR
jgi:hypothetical protein